MVVIKKEEPQHFPTGYVTAVFSQSIFMWYCVIFSIFTEGNISFLKLQEYVDKLMLFFLF